MFDEDLEVLTEGCDCIGDVVLDDGKVLITRDEFKNDLI